MHAAVIERCFIGTLLSDSCTTRARAGVARAARPNARRRAVARARRLYYMRESADGSDMGPPLALAARTRSVTGQCAIGWFTALSGFPSGAARPASAWRQHSPAQPVAGRGWGR